MTYRDKRDRIAWVRDYKALFQPPHTHTYMCTQIYGGTFTNIDVLI